MPSLSRFLNGISIGDPTTSAPAIRRATINTSTGAITAWEAGADLAISSDGATATGQLIASKVWNAVWNDVADFQLLCDELVYGKAYFDTADGAKICNQRCQMSVIGIASNTFGHAVGAGANPEREVPIAVSGWVLAFVDREYPCGTPLTNDHEGNLTEMTLEEKRNYPERLLGIYKKKEHDLLFGTEDLKIEVNNRHWIKVK